eukprot:scaffold38298_cov199-Amphora_coffeaeformis.AAC.1
MQKPRLCLFLIVFDLSSAWHCGPPYIRDIVGKEEGHTSGDEGKPRCSTGTGHAQGSDSREYASKT